MFGGLVQFLESQPLLHKMCIAIWKNLPPRAAGFMRQLLMTNYVVGAAAVIVDESTNPPEVLLARHTYRKRGVWGLPGGVLQSPVSTADSPKSDEPAGDILEATLRREVSEELGIGVEAVRLIRMDALPNYPEEPGARRLDFYYLCTPDDGFGVLRDGMASGEIKPRSPEVGEIRFVPLDRVHEYDVTSCHARFLNDCIPRTLTARHCASDEQVPALKQSIHSSYETTGEQEWDGIQRVVECLGDFQKELSAESVSLFTRDSEQNLVLAAAIQELPLDGSPAVIEIPAKSLSSDWNGLTRWLAFQSGPQRLNARALLHLLGKGHTSAEQPYLKLGKRISLISSVVPGGAPGDIPLGLLKAENQHDSNGKPIIQGFSGRDFRRIDQIACATSPLLLSLRQTYEASLDTRLTQLLRGVFSAIGTRAGVESGVCRVIQGLVPESKIVLWHYREGSPELIWPQDPSILSFIPSLHGPEEIYSRVRRTSMKREWEGFPHEGKAWTVRRVNLQKACWIENRPLYILDLQFSAPEPYADATERALTSLMEVTGEFLRVAAVRDESLWLLKHELGTALHPLTNYDFIIQTLVKSGFDKSAADAVKGFTAALRRWEDLVTRVEDFATIAANEDLAVNRQKVDSAAVIEGIAETWRPLAINRGLDLAVIATHEEVFTDPRLVRRAIAIALSNALSVSKTGTTVQLVSHTVDGGVEILVEDTGPGLCKEDRQLFLNARLRRRDAKRTGLGLGQLLLSKYGKALEAEVVCRCLEGRPGLAVGLRLPSRPGG